MRWNNKKQSRKKPNYGSNVPWSLLCPEGRKSRTQTNAGLHILTSKATGLVVILHFLSFPISILTNMNPNSRQVYTCISSADRLCISHTVSILFFSFSFFFRNGRSEGLMGLGRCLDMLFLFVFSKILPETKSKRSSSQCTLFPPPPSLKTEVKRNVQKFHVLTGRERLKMSY